jgi:hypothetical protein
VRIDRVQVDADAVRWRDAKHIGWGRESITGRAARGRAISVARHRRAAVGG